MTKLCVVTHEFTDCEAIEIWHDGILLGCIYPLLQPGIRLLTKYDVTSAVIEGTPNEINIVINATKRP